MKQRVLITGAMGYLGSRLAQYLETLERYDLVLSTRRLPVKRPEWLKKSLLVAEDQVPVVDAIVHLASANEIEAVKDPAGVLCDSARNIYQLVQSLPRRGKFIYVSTVHVYGSPLVGTINEGRLPDPRHPYAISRRMCEDVVFAAHKIGDIAGIVLRLSNGIGAPIHSDHTRWVLIGNDLCRQAVLDQKIVLKSPGSQYRDFIPMQDVLRAIDHALVLPTEKIADGLFNLGGERSLNVVEMARLIAQRCQIVCGYFPEILIPKSKEEPLPQPLKYEMEKWKATGFSLSTPLETEIDATLRYCLEKKLCGELR